MTALHSHPHVEEGPAPDLAWVATRYALPDVHQLDAICTCSLPSLANHGTYAHNDCCKTSCSRDDVPLLYNKRHSVLDGGRMLPPASATYNTCCKHHTLSCPMGLPCSLRGIWIPCFTMLLGTLYSFRTLCLVLYNHLLLHAMQQPLAL